jgi:hypothetical protein
MRYGRSSWRFGQGCFLAKTGPRVSRGCVRCLRGPKARRKSSGVGCPCPRLGSSEARSCPLSGPSLGLITPIRPLQLCADGGYQLRLGVLGVPLVMVPDKFRTTISGIGRRASGQFQLQRQLHRAITFNPCVVIEIQEYRCVCFVERFVPVLSIHRSNPRFAVNRRTSHRLHRGSSSPASFSIVVHGSFFVFFFMFAAPLSHLHLPQPPPAAVATKLAPPRAPRPTLASAGGSAPAPPPPAVEPLASSGPLPVPWCVRKEMEGDRRC